MRRGTPTTHSGALDHDGRYSSAFSIAIKNRVGRGGEGRKNVSLRRSRHSLQHHLGRGLVGLTNEPFETWLPVTRSGDDRVEKARERREFAVYPYRNPKPFDHRGVRTSESFEE